MNSDKKTLWFIGAVNKATQERVIRYGNNGMAMAFNTEEAAKKAIRDLGLDRDPKWDVFVFSAEGEPVPDKKH